MIRIELVPDGTWGPTAAMSARSTRRWRLLALARKVSAMRTSKQEAWVPLFGSSLKQLGHERAITFVESCHHAVEGVLATEPWLFRQSAPHSKVEEAVARADAEGVLTLEYDDPPELAICVLKQWLRELPKPLLPREVYRSGDTAAAVLARLKPPARDLVSSVMQLARASLNSTAHLEHHLRADSMARLLAPHLIHTFSQLKHPTGSSSEVGIHAVLDTDAALIRTLLATEGFERPTESSRKEFSPHGGREANLRDQTDEGSDRWLMRLRADLTSLENQVDALSLMHSVHDGTCGLYIHRIPTSKHVSSPPSSLHAVPRDIHSIECPSSRVALRFSRAPPHCMHPFFAGRADGSRAHKGWSNACASHALVRKNPRVSGAAARARALPRRIAHPGQ